MTVTDQQLQPILAYWGESLTKWNEDFIDLVASGKPLDDPGDSVACLWVVMQALRERGATIAELRKPADGTLVGQLSGFLTVLASYAHITGDQGEKLRWAASLLLSLQRDLVELRKPVAVEPNKLVERIRERNKTGEFNIAYSRQRALDDLLSAYDTLAQNHAREVSAREAIAAEVRWLRQSISSMQLKAAEVADDYCGRLLAAQERERQLQSKIDSLEAQLRNQN